MQRRFAGCPQVRRARVGSGLQSAARPLRIGSKCSAATLHDQDTVAQKGSLLPMATGDSDAPLFQRIKRGARGCSR